MAKKDLTIIYLEVKTKVESLIEMVQRESNIPAYLMAGIVDGISSSLNRQALKELTVANEKYVKELNDELSQKEDTADVTADTKPND